MTKLITRAQWGALDPTEPPNRNFTGHEMIGITWHHTGSQTDAQGSSLQHVQAIDRAALAGTLPAGKFIDLPYNAIFNQAGDIYIGRDWKLYQGAHALSHDGVANKYTFGYAFLGNSTVTGVSEAAIDAMHVLTWLSTVAAGRKMAHWGHRDWAADGGIGTNCPGDNVEEIARQLMAGK